MLKFFLISAIIWFIIIKLLRFKFVVYKAPGSGGFNQSKRREGSISMSKTTVAPNKDNKRDKGEYVEYEEVK